MVIAWGIFIKFVLLYSSHPLATGIKTCPLPVLRWRLFLCTRVNVFLAVALQA